MSYSAMVLLSAALVGSGAYAGEKVSIVNTPTGQTICFGDIPALYEPAPFHCRILRGANELFPQAH
jgi:hypothetical protein